MEIMNIMEKLIVKDKKKDLEYKGGKMKVYLKVIL
jgi:hypothetical protein